MGLGDEDIQRVKARVLPWVPVHRWLQGYRRLGYNASPNGRTCASTVFSPRAAQFSISWAAPARNVSWEEIHLRPF